MGRLGHIRRPHATLFHSFIHRLRLQILSQYFESLNI